MRQLRLGYWYAQAFWQKYKKWIVASVFLGVVSVWFFPTIIQLLPKQQNTRYIGRVGMYGWLEIPTDIQSKVSAGLTALDSSGNPVPVLAERWTVEEDGRAFRFLLKDNLHWQDGRLLTAQDINYNFTDVQVVPNEDEILFRLQDAYSPFPTVVAQPLFRQEQIKKYGFIKQNKIIGLGEYKVIKVTYRNSFISQLIIESSKERLIYRFFPSQEEALTAFRLGQVDELENLSSIENLTDQEKSLYQVDETINPNQYVALYFNASDVNLSKEMRQALNYATHKPGPEDPRLRALGPIPASSWAYNTTDEVQTFSYNLPKAIELYQSVNPSQKLEITLDSSLSLLNEAQQVAQDWRLLGEAAKLACQAKAAQDEPGCDRYLIEPQVRVIRDTYNFQAALLARETPPDPDQYSWWHSTQANNISRYQNPRVDKLLEDARKEISQQKRKILYFEFQQYLVEDVPAIFMYYMPEYTLIRKQIL